jgi:hypothetical protein
MAVGGDHEVLCPKAALPSCNGMLKNGFDPRGLCLKGHQAGTIPHITAQHLGACSEQGGYRVLCNQNLAAGAERVLAGYVPLGLG